jgi:hypothetical protein
MLARQGSVALRRYPPQSNLKGLFTMKKLLALTLVAGLIGLTTGCPGPESSGKKDTLKTTTKTTESHMKEGGKKEDVKKEETKKEDSTGKTVESTKKEDVKKEEPKKDK